jgi:hypothetical protein
MLALSGSYIRNSNRESVPDNFDGCEPETGAGWLGEAALKPNHNGNINKKGMRERAFRAIMCPPHSRGSSFSFLMSAARSNFFLLNFIQYHAEAQMRQYSFSPKSSSHHS